jgi:DNA-binding MarR family transcriptional regulator
MSSTFSDNRTTLLEPLIRLMGFRLSTATVLYHTAIADRLGVSATDLKCYSILMQSGPMTAGELAERTGLTTGAITGVVDRLEKAALARRAPDVADRRRVVVELIPDSQRHAEIQQLYEPMGQAIIALTSSYSDDDIATLTDFLSRASSVLETETARLRQKPNEKG